MEGKGRIMKHGWKWIAAALALMLAISPAALAEDGPGGAAKDAPALHRPLPADDGQAGAPEEIEAEAGDPEEEAAPPLSDAPDDSEPEDGADQSASEEGPVRYYYFVEDGQLLEYGGIRISLDELMEFDGAQEIVEGAMDEGYAIEDIIYRANGVINLNLRRDGEDASFSLRYDDASVRFWQECAGSYALARNPDAAVYPEAFQHPKGAEETGEPEEPEDELGAGDAEEPEDEGADEGAEEPEDEGEDEPESEDAEESAGAEPGYAREPAPGWGPVPEWQELPGSDARDGAAQGGKHRVPRDEADEDFDGWDDDEAYEGEASDDEVLDDESYDDEALDDEAYDEAYEGEASGGAEGDILAGEASETDGDAASTRRDGRSRGKRRGEGSRAGSACLGDARCGEACACGGARYVYTTGDSALRTGPGASFGSLCALPEGILVEYLGEQARDDRGVTWYYLRWDGNSGWSAAVDIQSGN